MIEALASSSLIMIIRMIDEALASSSLIIIRMMDEALVSSSLIVKGFYQKRRLDSRGDFQLTPNLRCGG
jgi:hypothetical protein